MVYKDKELKRGHIVEGTVVKVEPNTIYLDIQYITEGKIHLDNYGDPSLESFVGHISEGDKVTARIQSIRTEEPVQILMSRLPLLQDENFKKIEALVESQETVFAKVRRVEEKGLVLSYLEHELFLPYKLLDHELVNEKDSLKGKSLEVNIIEAQRRGRMLRIVASRKTIFERERQEAYDRRIQERQEELETINTGDVLTGVVSKLEDHAATIKFKNIVGLLRISQVSHYRIDKIQDVLNMDQEVTVKVIKKEGNRLDLSIKALQKTPYEVFYENHKVGDTVTGTVHQKLPFGIIVELERDVRGLLHKNEFSWNPNDNFDAHVKIGDEVTLAILSLDEKKERIALSRKALEDNPWRNVTVKRGEVVKAVIQEVDKDGLKVEVQGVTGEIPASELAVERIKAEDYFAVGDEVEAVVTDVNKNQWVLKLSIRRILEQSARESYEKYLEDDADNSNVTIGDLFKEELKEK